MGDRPTEAKVRSLVAWIAEKRKTESLKPIDKAIYRMVSKPSGRNESERRSSLEKSKPQRPSTFPEGEGSMDRRRLTDVAVHSGGVKATARWQGRATQDTISNWRDPPRSGITKNAKIVEEDPSGNETILREGNNGWTCFPGHPGVVGDDTMCLDEPALQWLADLAAHKPKPTNTRPGILYMLTGGIDFSASDPWATSGTPLKEPPHWALVWPFDPKEAGLSDKPKTTGTWIMYAGTPYAHLMINQKP